MNYKPAIFNGAMVQALLCEENPKTQTRRPIKGISTYASFEGLSDDMAVIRIDKHGNEVEKPVRGLYATFCRNGEPEFPVHKMQYQPGDVIWVRETWGIAQYSSGSPINGSPADPLFIYRADGDISKFYSENHGIDISDQYVTEYWKPSIHMPREAARIFLRVTDVRVERVRDISEDDARAEGVEVFAQWARYNDPKRSFELLWDSIYDKNGYGWDANPWVEATTFERVEKPADWPY